MLSLLFIKFLGSREQRSSSCAARSTSIQVGLWGLSWPVFSRFGHSARLKMKRAPSHTVRTWRRTIWGFAVESYSVQEYEGSPIDLLASRVAQDQAPVNVLLCQSFTETLSIGSDGEGETQNHIWVRHSREFAAELESEGGSRFLA